MAKRKKKRAQKKAYAKQVSSMVEQDRDLVAEWSEEIADLKQRLGGIDQESNSSGDTMSQLHQSSGGRE